MANVELIERELSAKLVGAFYDSYNKLGYGFLESVYANAFAIELQKRGIRFRREVPIEVIYDGVPIGRFRVDMLVEERVVVDFKSSQDLPTHAQSQMLNYLACTSLELGIVFHYGPKAKFHRVVNSRRRPRR